MNNWHEWIRKTHPQPGDKDIPEDTLISIVFNQDINRHTLNTRNILVLDGNQGGRLISDRFLFRYETEDKTLLIYRKSEAERLGSQNTIEIILTGRIANLRSVKMTYPFHLRFTTR
ncbi:Ig-like domain-containing protein [Paenibacillaceae bacterium WGS1546]|uniref:Ig-like domain-containing protein n=1 Tax=Cohnella sp. WGS1546 TaxID=3366810 RepID=UPI00372CEB52